MVFRRPEDYILAVYGGTALVYLLQGLAIGAAAASCNILHDTADTERDHISDMLLLQQEFISGNPTLRALFLHER